MQATATTRKRFEFGLPWMAASLIALFAAFALVVALMAEDGDTVTRSQSAAAGNSVSREQTRVLEENQLHELTGAVQSDVKAYDHLGAGQGWVGYGKVVEQPMSRAETQFIEQNQLHELTGAVEQPMSWAEIRLREMNELPELSAVVAQQIRDEIEFAEANPMIEYPIERQQGSLNWAETRRRELNDLPGFTSERQQQSQQQPASDGRIGITE